MGRPPPRLTFLAIVLAAAAACGGSGNSDPPLPPAVNTVPFTGGVYFPGLWQDQIGLQRLWPTRATSYDTGFQPANPYFVFRPSDGQLFYGLQPYGVFIDDSPTTSDSLVPTPPCAPTPGSGGVLSGNFELPFGFDAQNRMYDYCGALQRDGQTITGPPPGFFFDRVLGDAAWSSTSPMRRAIRTARPSPPWPPTAASSPGWTTACRRPTSCFPRASPCRETTRSCWSRRWDRTA